MADADSGVISIESRIPVFILDLGETWSLGVYVNILREKEVSHLKGFPEPDHSLLRGQRRGHGLPVKSMRPFLGYEPDPGPAWDLGLAGGIDPNRLTWSLHGKGQVIVSVFKLLKNKDLYISVEMNWNRGVFSVGL